MKRLTFFFTTAVCTIVGLYASYLADAELKSLPEKVTIVDGWVWLNHSLNPGIAFGVQLPFGIQTLLIFVALVIVLWFGIFTAKTEWAEFSFGLIAAGGIANIIDRLRDGYVTDYFHIGSFPIFNVADSFVTVGVFLLFVELILERKRQKTKGESAFAKS